MAKLTRLTLEIGPKGKKVAAVAPDWPGLERGAKTAEDAIERLRSYIPRYLRVAKLAGMEAESGTVKNVRVVEEYPGTGSTDFWGISFAFPSIDKQAMPGDELERELTLMRRAGRSSMRCAGGCRLRCRGVPEGVGVIGTVLSVIRLPQNRIGRG